MCEEGLTPHNVRSKTVPNRHILSSNLNKHALSTYCQSQRRAQVITYFEIIRPTTLFRKKRA